MEEISGGRMHYMFNRVGGLKEEIPAGWLARARRVIDEVRAALPVIGAALGQDGFRHRTRGIGVLTPPQVRQYGVSGPAARACGVDFDLRRDEPYLAYPELAGVLRVPVRAEGDCLARFECLSRSASGLPGPGPGMRRTARQPPPGPAEREVAEGVQGA